jgi:hypothetical protein
VSDRDHGWNGAIGKRSDQFVPSQFPVWFPVWSAGKSASTKAVPGVPGCGAVPLYEVKHFYKQNQPGTGRTVGTDSQIKDLHGKRDGTVEEQEREPTVDIGFTEYSVYGILDYGVGS